MAHKIKREQFINLFFFQIVHVYKNDLFPWQCCRKWGFIPTVGILRGLVGIIFFKWGLKFLAFSAKCWDFFQILLGFLKKWGNYSKMLGFFFKNCWIFWKKWGNFCKMWGFLGGKSGGDKWGFLANLVGNFSRNLPATLITTINKTKQLEKFWIEFR